VGGKHKEGLPPKNKEALKGVRLRFVYCPGWGEERERNYIRTGK